MALGVGVTGGSELEIRLLREDSLSVWLELPNDEEADDSELEIELLRELSLVD